MKKFEFKLAPVLKIRKSREEIALRDLARAQRAYQAEIAKKAALQRQLAESLARREQLGQEPVTPNAFRTEQDFINGTKHRIIIADQCIVRASKGVEKALRAYLHARRQTRMIEVLYEKAYSEHRKARMKYEAKQIDDLSIMRARFREEIA